MQKLQTCKDLKNVDIFEQIAGLQCSWVQILFDHNLHEWIAMSICLIKKYLEKKFKFCSNFQIKTSLIIFFPSFYQNIFQKCSRFLLASVIVTSSTMS